MGAIPHIGGSGRALFHRMDRKPAPCGTLRVQLADDLFDYPERVMHTLPFDSGDRIIKGAICRPRLVPGCSLRRPHPIRPAHNCVLPACDGRPA